MADNILYQGRLVVTADTLQAENALKSLQGSLNSLLSNPSPKNNLNNNFKETLQTVTTLKTALNGAINTDTGKLNLTKFNQSLMASKTSFSELSTKLKGMGAEGQNAFLQLARSISTAEVPLKKTNNLLQDFAATLRNTVKWQISSSIVHGFMGAIQTAIGYTKDLDKSLNNIRIVTGNSAEEMAKFAKEANKAAKSLGTTTTAYSNASLIYYQQGLSDEEVKKRTDVTVKMANVTKESAQDVSNYMTAIWNNFDDGSKSLEYYADVMTALGAATASSTDEIAAGLEKFAAVADTIGLSYEYATAALATVTAETRQSADVVGNSFKTLFSRIQGLNLGDTLDDGTTFNKYSNALNKVGISIKDSNGDLKAMDEILNEMGSKWNTLAKDEQMALAQTVGGVRQYNQLISLMDNWGTFQDNLKTATTSSGELQKQADIYAESWEASSKRVRAAAEGIYDSLINEDFFIGVNNTLEDTLGIIERLIDSLGGMPGVLALVGVAMTKAFAPGMTKSITEGLYNLGSGKNDNTEAIKQIREQARKELKDRGVFGQEGSSERVAFEGQANLADADLAFEQYKSEHNINETQQAYYDAQKEAYQEMNAKRVENLEKIEANDIRLGELNENKKQIKSTYGWTERQEDYLNSIDTKDLSKNQKNAYSRTRYLMEHKEQYTKFRPGYYEKALEALYKQMGNAVPSIKDLTNEINELAEAAGETDLIDEDEIKRLEKEQKELQEKNKGLEAGERQARENMNPENIDRQKDSIANVGEGLSKSIQGVSELAVGVTAISGAIQTLNDDTLSFGEKFTTVLMSTATSIPSIVDGLKNVSEGLNLFKGNLKEAISKIVVMRLGTTEQVAALTAETGALQGETLAQTASNLAKTKGLALLGKYLLIIGAVVAVVWALVAAYQAARANSIEGRLEKTNKALEETQTAAEEAKTALEKLSGAFDNYNNTVKALDECTKGTKEYRDALREANIAALDLLQAHPELYSTGGVTTNSEGLIGISEEAQGKLIEDQEKAIVNTERAKNILTANKTDLEIQQLESNYIVDKQHSMIQNNFLNEKYQATKDQGLEGKYARESDNASIETQIKEAMALAYDAVEDDYSAENFKTSFYGRLRSSDNYVEGIEQFIDYDQIQSWADGLAASNEKLKIAIEANTATNKLSNEQAVKNALGEKAEGKTDAEIAILGGALYQREQQIYKSIADADSDIQNNIYITDERNDKEVKALWERYQKAAGVNYELADNAVLGTDTNRTFQYIGEDGKPHQIAIETMASEIAAAEAAKELNEGTLNTENIISALENVELLNLSTTNTDDTFNAKKIFSDYIANGDFSNLTKDEWGKMGPLTEGMIEEAFNGVDADTRAAIAVAAGAKDWEAYKKGMAEASKNVNFDEIFASLKFEPNTKLETFNGLTIGLQENIASALNNIFTTGGEDAANSLNQMLIDMVENGLDEETIQEALDFINNYDFKNGSIEDFQLQLSNITGGMVGAGYASNKFAAAMKETGNNVPVSQLKDFISQLEKLIDLVSKLKIGDIIDDGVIASLRAAGVNIEDFATKTFKGWVLTKEIPMDALQAQAETLYETGNALYNGVKNKIYQVQKDSNPNNLIKDNLTAAELAQYYIGKTNIGDQLAAIDLLTKGLGENKYSLFAESGSKDEIDRLLSGKGTSEDYDKMLNAIVSAINAAEAGEYNPDNLITSKVTAADSANDIANVKGFYDENNKISKAGAEGLQAYAAQGGEDYTWALDEYNKALETANGNENLAAEAAEKLYKNLQLIERTKAGSKIREIANSLDKIDEMDFNERNKSIANLTKSVEDFFGIDIDDKLFYDEENLKALQEWVKGIEGAEEKLFNLLNVITKEDIEEWKVKIGAELEEEQFNSVSQVIDGFLDGKAIDPISLKVVGEANFGQLLNSLVTLKVPLETAASLLKSLGKSSLDPQGFEEFSNLLSSYCEIMGRIQNGGNIGDLDSRNLKSLAARLKNIGFKATVPSEVDSKLEDLIPPDTPSGGGGNSSSREDLVSDLSQKQMDIYDKKIQKSEAQRAGLDPEKQSEYIKNEIELLEEEQKILEKQIQTYKKLLKEKVDAFNQKYANKGFEIQLTDDGMISNLTELYAKLQKELEDADSKDRVRMIENMMQDLEEATNLQGHIDENVASIADKERQEAEKALEDITQRIDWRIKKIDYQIERLNYYQEKLLIQAHGNKQTIEAMLEGFQYQEQEMLQLFEKGDAIRQGIAELEAAKAQYPDYAQMFDEQILEYQSDLIDLNMDILELRQEMEELVQNVLDLALEEIDTQTERIDKYVSMLDHFQNIIDLSGRTMLDQALKVQIGTAKVETMVNKMSVLKKQMEGLSEAVNLAQEALAKRRADGDDSSVSFWENQVEVLKQELETATEEFLGSWEDALKSAAELFEMRVELAIANLSDALSPFASLETFQKNYENQKAIIEQYLDDATRLYELNKLNRELNKNIADENDLLGRSKLKDIQQQILDLQKAGVRMSQFDLDILQKRYDLQLAEIALMEAQNSKTSMRLVRDAAGNWNYVYDADEEKIEDATQKYEDALYELDKLAKEYVDDVSKQLIDIQVEYSEALAGLDRNSADYQNQVLVLQEHYLERQRYLLEELNKGAIESGLTFHDTLYGQMMDIYSYEDAYNQFLGASNDTVNELIVNYKDWQSIVETAMNVAGTSWEDFGADTEGTLDSLEEHIEKLCDEISKLVDVLMAYVHTSIGMVEDWQSKYSKEVDANIAANERIIDNAGLHGGTSAGPRRAPWGRSIGGGAVLYGVNSSSGRSSSVANFADLSKLSDGSIVGFYVGDGPAREMIKIGNELYGTSQNHNGLERIGFKEALNKYGSDNVQAFTDKSQINLNKIVTIAQAFYDMFENGLNTLKDKKFEPETIIENIKNFLEESGIGDYIQSGIDQKVSDMISSTNNILSDLIRQIQLPVYETQPIDQKVEIMAEFPGVTNHSEIEEALTNLSINASQYLNLNKNI